MVEMTGRPQRAILEDMRNWKVWVSALTLVVALGCGGFGGGLSSAEVDDIYDICSTKSAEVNVSSSPRGRCVAAAGWLIAAHDQGGSCDFQEIVATLHRGVSLWPDAVAEDHCPPDRRPLFQRWDEWLADGATQLGMLLVTVVVVGGTLLRERWQKKHPPRGQ